MNTVMKTTDGPEWKEELAVIKDARLGSGDYGGACLMFNAYLSQSTCAFQVVSWDDAYGIMSLVQRDTDLNGRTCYVKTNGLISVFDRMSGI
jgi:hypothetical protein